MLTLTTNNKKIIRLNRIPISLLKLQQPAPGQQVIAPKVAQEVLAMLESVIMQGGTAPRARVAGYSVAGKTGTARLIGPGGYLKNRHDGTFIGMAPASDPRLLVAVYLHDLQSVNYYAGYTAGPIFSKIMGGSLRLLNIPPDNLEPTVASRVDKVRQPLQGEDA